MAAPRLTPRLSPRLGPGLGVVVLACAAACLCGAGEAKVATASTVPWVLPMQPVSRSIKQGQVVTLTWSKTPQPHDVRLFSDSSTYGKCHFAPKGKRAKTLVKASNTGSYGIPWPGKGVTKYYGCSVGAVRNVGGHCSAGQKIAVTGI